MNKINLNDLLCSYNKQTLCSTLHNNDIDSHSVNLDDYINNDSDNSYFEEQNGETETVDQNFETNDNIIINSQNNDSQISFGSSIVSDTAVDQMSPVLTKKKIKKMVDDIQTMKKEGLISCCKKLKCHTKFIIEEIEDIRVKTHQHGVKFKRFNVSNGIKHEISKKNNYKINGKIVCSKFYKFVFGVSNYSLYNSGNNLVKQIDFNSNIKNSLIQTWLENMGQYSEYQPNSNEIHLPFNKKKYVYEIFMKSIKDDVTINNNVKSISDSLFYKVWKQKCNKIKVRRWTTFSKCDICVNTNTKLAGRIDHAQKLEILAAYNPHKTMVYEERSAYKKKALNSTMNPKLFLSIIIDGSNMGCYGFPYFSQKTKSTSTGYKIIMKLVGVIVHGIGSYVFIVRKDWESDGNLTIEALNRVFNDIGRENLPKTLYLQV